MAKSYSQWNLLQEKLMGFDKKSFFDILFTSKYRYIKIQLPYYEYLRGEVFAQDFNDLYEEDSSVDFSIEHLISLLYDDYLTQVKKGIKYDSMARFLVDSKYRYLSPPTTQKRVMKQVNTNLFSFETVEEVISIKDDNKEKIAYVTIRIKESEILRGEIFLHDLSPLIKEEISLEDLITILYLDFIEKHKQNGNNTEIMKAILTKLNVD